MYIVYVTTNLITEQIYFGVHEQEEPYQFDGYLGSGIWRGKKRYSKSKQSLNDAINQYGRENFKRETLFYYWTEREAYAKEKEIVTEELIKHDWNYNLTVGGTGTFNHINERRKNDPEFDKMCYEKQAIAVSKAHKNKPKSKEQKLKMSISNIGKNKHSKGKNNPMFGKNHSEETCKLIGDSRRGKSFCRWVTNGLESKYILKHLPTPDGWREGRTVKKDANGILIKVE